MKPRSFHKSDVLLYLIFAVVGIALFCVILLPARGQTPTTVRVTVDGQLYGTYSILENQTITITQADGKKNVLVIEDGGVYMKEASCKNQICVNTGTITQAGQSITCLPNRVSVQLEGGDDDGYDAVIR